MSKKQSHEERLAKLQLKIDQARAANVDKWKTAKPLKQARHKDFWTYFNVADELSDPDMVLEDLDPRWVATAHRFATKTHGINFDLPWPPDLAAAEEFRLSNIEFTDGKEGW